MRALKNARSVRQQLEQEVRKAIPGVALPLSSAKDVESICRAVTAGFFNNAGVRCGAGGADSTVYKHLEGLMPNEDLKLIYIHPTSVLASGGAAPQFVAYHELVYTARPFMRHVLGVERAWLMECRARIGKATLAQLSGGALHGEEEEQQEQEKEAAGANEEASEGAAETAPAAAPKERTSQEALEAARRRFLERKQQQAAQQAANKRR